MNVILYPQEISCLLYYYTKTAVNTAGYNDNGIDRLLQLKLIDKKPTRYAISRRGVAHIIQLMECKIPVQVWKIEGTEDKIIKTEDIT